MERAEMINKVRELKELKAMAEELAAEISTIEDLLKAEMVERGTEEITVDVFKVRYTTVTSNRIDTTAIKKEMPEIAAKYTKQSITKRFSVA